MSIFRGTGKRRIDMPTRTNTGSSIRGRIGPPIPILDDDEFPIRLPGTGIATPLGDEGIEKQLRRRESMASERNIASEELILETSDPIGHTAIQPSTPTRASPEAGSRTKQASPLRNSQITVPSGSGVGNPPKKKSSLRSVIGRLFGKKKKGEALANRGSQEKKSSDSRGQHRSDPTALNRNPADLPNPQKRSASLPINEYNRALRSHSTIVEDFPLISNSLDSPRESLQAENYTRARGASIPSRLWTPNKTPGHGLSPRPASSHPRGSKIFDDHEVESSIGMAVTSGSHPNRRSRSLGQLREADITHPIARRRSDEIRYWRRQSYDPGLHSPMSSNKADAEMEEPVIMDEPEVPSEKLIEQPQPFNFGPMSEMAGMKITQAANLETRVLQLEERMAIVERTLSGNQSRTSTGPLYIQDPPRRISRYERGSSASRPPTGSSELSLPAHKFRESNQFQLQGDAPSQVRSTSAIRRPSFSAHNSYHPSLDTFTNDDKTPDAPLITGRSPSRPLSTTTTIRGLPSSPPTLAKDAVLTGEHYTLLMDLILAERTAREQLEALVESLQHELHAFRSAASYPTLGSDHHSDPLGGGTAVGGEFSSFEQDDSSDDEGRYLQEEVFKTPNEERGEFGDQIFGDVATNGTKGAARTLSLSQITLNKGVGVNF